MLFEDKVSSAFADKVKAIGGDLNINPDSLMACMGFETGYSYRADIKNSIGATGLIQFLPSTAKNLGTNTDTLAAMPSVAQLDYVKLYYSNVLKQYQIKNLADAYLAIFYPAALNQDDSYVFPDNVYKANKPFDLDGKGYITKADIGHFIAYKTAKNSGGDISGIVGDTEIVNNDLWHGVNFDTVTNYQLLGMDNYSSLIIAGAAIIITVILFWLILSYLKLKR